MKDNFVIVMIFIAATCSFAFGFLAGRGQATDDHQISAIKAGVAEYYIDANNERSFRWKGSK